MLPLILALALSVDGGSVLLGPCKTTQTVCFSPGGQCDKPLVATIDAAQHTADVAIYSLNRASIVDALVRAKARGVAVRVVVDYSQAGNAKEAQQLLKLQAAGIPMRRDSHVGIMHLKMVVTDSTVFSVGSFNFTDPAVDSNDEVVMVWSCPRNALLFQAKFDQMWNATVGFKDLVLDAGTADGGVL